VLGVPESPEGTAVSTSSQQVAHRLSTGINVIREFEVLGLVAVGSTNQGRPAAEVFNCGPLIQERASCP
jgi:hypothetical protein